MGVCFSPKNNMDYCRQNNLVVIDEYESEVFPFELDIANANARNLASILNLDLEGEYGTVGEVHPQVILRAIKALPTSMVELMVRKAIDPFDGGAGTYPEHIRRYLDQLKKVCLEAERREEMVVWS